MLKSQQDIVKELDIDSESYRRYKKLTTLIPELQDMVDTGKLTTSVASRIIAKLTPEEQEQLILTYGKNEIEKATQKQTQDMINKMQELENKNKGYNHC